MNSIQALQSKGLKFALYNQIKLSIWNNLVTLTWEPLEGSRMPNRSFFCKETHT